MNGYGPFTCTWPSGANTSGNHIAAASLVFNPSGMKALDIRLQVKNLWGEDALYPINSTGNVEEADGTPALEERSWWMSLNFKI